MRGQRWWCQLPINHLDDEGYLALSWGARGLLADLYRTADKAGRFPAGQRALSRLVGASEWQAELSELVDGGFVELFSLAGSAVLYGEVIAYADTVGQLQKKRSESDIVRSAGDAIYSSWAAGHDMVKTRSGPVTDQSLTSYRPVQDQSQTSHRTAKDGPQSFQVVEQVCDQSVTSAGPVTDRSLRAREKTKQKAPFQGANKGSALFEKKRLEQLTPEQQAAVERLRLMAGAQ